MQYIRPFNKFFESSAHSRIFCDMDGVLSNWNKAFEDLSGLTMQQFIAANSVSAAWRLVTKAGSQFWAGMEWMPDGKSLWQFIEAFNPTILSSPSRDKSSIEGKAEWLERNLDWTFPYITKMEDWSGEERTIFYGEKWQFATGPGDILIDDTPKKIEGWVKAGGTGILHTSAEETIRELKQLGFNK